MPTPSQNSWAAATAAGVVGQVVVGARAAERRQRRGGGEQVHLRGVVLGGTEERLPLLTVLLPGRCPEGVAGAVVEGECDRDDAGPGHPPILPNPAVAARPGSSDS